ncbi:hypothetical protein Tco_1394186 [Tanacetum coccineum]
MAEPNDYNTATRKNFVSIDNKGRMVEKCIVEIQGTLLVKIRDYAFNGNIGENTFKHIDKFLKVVGPIKINGLTQDRFRLSVFPVSLAGAAKLNNDKAKDTEEPWSENGVPYQLCDHICEPYRFKSGETKIPACTSDIDGFCNGGKLPRMVQVGSITYFQDHKWYNELANGKLNDETLARKAKIKGSWGDATPGVNAHEITPFTYMENFGRGPYANMKTKWTSNPYLDVNRICGRNYEASNVGETQENQGHEEHKVIIEQRVKDNQKARMLGLKRRNHEDYYSDILYAVYIKEDTVYPCLKLHSASTKRRLIRRSTRFYGEERRRNPKKVSKFGFFWAAMILCDCDKSTKLQQGLDGCSMVQYCSLSRLRLMFSWLRGVTTGNIRVPKSSQQTLIFNARAAAKDSHLLLLPMTICANTAAKDVNKRTAQVRFVCWYDGPQERVLLIGTNNGLYCSFLRSILVLLVVTYGTAVSFAAAYDEYVLLSAKCQENCEFDWLLGARGQFKFVPVVTWTLYRFFYFVPMVSD